MSKLILPRRGLAALAGGTAVASLLGGRARAQAGKPKLRLLTNWYAQAEHGGFYQAKAKGFYDRASVDTEIRMGGPQVNSTQLLLGGECDVMVGYPLQALKAQEQGLPVVAMGTCFQFDLVGLMTHDDVGDIAQLKDHKILIANSSRTTWWPWARHRFGFTDAQAGTYTFNLQPFLADPKSAVQAYISSEPYEAANQGAKVRFHLLADAGYPPYGIALITTRAFLQNNAETLRSFLRASAEGWKDYVTGDPAPGNALIQRDNPRMTQDRINYGISKLREIRVLDGKEAAQNGICTMTEDRWKQTRDFMVEAGLLREDAPWRNAFDLGAQQGLRVMLT